MATDLRSQLSALLARQEDRVQELQTALTACRAVGPENGGQGEAAKAELVLSLLARAGVTDIVRADAPDDRVPSGSRPNFIATLPGSLPGTLWLFAHLDVVPAGDLSLWHSDPWRVVREGDLLYGRGTEDNQQALVSMLILTEALQSLGITERRTLRIVCLSDEECGNARGLGHLLAARPELFGSGDLYIVPDGGSPAGDEIEIAEKSIFWIRATVTGRQCHASTPDKGVNALVAASEIILALQGLSDAFPEENPLFSPPCSTFTPTRREGGVDSVNILPGSDVFWMDCRLLPGTDPDEVLAKARALAGPAAALRGASVQLEKAMLQPASATPADAPVVRDLARALEAEGVRPRCIGIGGGTVAALLRRQGLSACVWSSILCCCHEPDEHSSIAATLKDARVFARLLLEDFR